MPTATIAKPYTLNQVSAMAGVTRQTLMQWVRAGRFPRPLAIGMHRHYWDRRTVERALGIRV